MLTYFLIGAFLGAVTGIPIGPVNVAVIDAAYRHSLRRALGVALGGAAADVVFAYLGVVWFGPFIAERPLIPPILYLFSGVVLMVYGLITVRAQEIETSSSDTTQPGQRSRKFFGGFVLGSILILLNPAALVTWVVIVGGFFAEILVGEGTSLAIGVGFGSAAWFTLVAVLSNKGKNVLGHKMLWVTRTVGALLIGYGVYSAGRGVLLLYRLA